MAAHSKNFVILICTVFHTIQQCDGQTDGPPGHG